MFKFIKNLFKKKEKSESKKAKKRTWEESYLDFIEGLFEKEVPKVKIKNYLYGARANFDFKELDVEVEFNDIRRKWDIKVWSKKAHSHIYYYDYFDKTPYLPINYLIAKYNLREEFDKILKEEQEKRDHENKIKSDIIKKYSN